MERIIILLFLYESLVTFSGFIVLYFLRQRPAFLRRGETASLYLIWYGIGRFFIEGMRTDSLYIGPLRVSQVLSLVLVIAGALLIWYRRKYLYPPVPYYSEGVQPDIELAQAKAEQQKKGR